VSWTEGLHRTIDAVIGVLGSQSITVVDVGARWGASDSWWRLPRLAKYVGFDPDPEECDRLNPLVPADENARFVPLALGRTHGTRDLHITVDPACSSLYPPDQRLAERYPGLRCTRRVETSAIDLVPLDAWTDAEGVSDVRFMKLDTQGSELDILRGAERTLEGCCGVQVEVEFSPIYEGQPLFSNVDTFLRRRGFALWRLTEKCHYAEDKLPGGSLADVSYFGDGEVPFESGSGRLFWANAIYFRDFHDLEPSPERGSQRLVLAALLHALGDAAGTRACLDRLLREDSDRLDATHEHALREHLALLRTHGAKLRKRRRAGRWRWLKRRAVHRG
jgi:FkbM family methyltransferase